MGLFANGSARRIPVLLVFLLGFEIVLARSLSASGQNLIPNPSVEQPAADPTIPAGWSKSGWGDNKATYSYRKGKAQDGQRSLMVSVSQYKDGDAKWYFNPINVQPGERYVYSEYYRSDVASTIYLQVQNASGAFSHQYLGATPKTRHWVETVYHFIIPADAVQVTVFHALTSVGFLETDNFILELARPLELTDGVPNASLEQTHEGTDVPAGWQTGNWGNNTAAFSYLKEGHAGRRSVKATITAYKDGDAKWYFDPQPATAGQHYRFSDWYRSNVTTKVAVMIIQADGTTQYLGLPPAEPSRKWRRYSVKFVMPRNAVRATMFHVLDSVGYLVTDDYSFLPSPTVGFSRPLVSLTFDDGWKSVVEQALPILERYRAPATDYIMTGTVGVASEYMNVADLRRLADAGHQIASHSVTHADLTTLGRRAVDRELRESREFLEKNGFAPILDWASPYGVSNSATTEAAKKYYRSQRSAQSGYNSKDDFDIYALKVQNVTLATTADEVRSWVEQAVQDKTWLILLYHEVGTSDREYNTTPAQLEAHLEIIKNAGVTIVTVDQALKEILPQL